MPATTDQEAPLQDCAERIRASEDRGATPGHAICPCLGKQCAISGHAGLQPLTEGQHRPKAGKKKKTCEAGLFFSGFCFACRQDLDLSGRSCRHLQARYLGAISRARTTRERDEIGNGGAL